MRKNIQKIGLTVAALAALAVGASALANAASTGSNTTTSQAPSAQGPKDGERSHGRHVGSNGQREQPLTGETAAKVKAAALEKVSGTVERVETDVDFGSPYEAHVRKPDGSEVQVLVNKQFEVTAVKAQGGPRGH